MIQKILLILLFVFSLNTAQADDNTASNTFQSDNDKIIINDIPLSYNIKIVGSDSRFVYNLLDARVTVKNRDTNRHYLEYKFVWYDQSGFEIAKDKSKWRDVYIDAKDSIILKNLAVTPKIDSFKFYIRGVDG